MSVKFFYNDLLGLPNFFFHDLTYKETEEIVIKNFFYGLFYAGPGLN